MQGAQFGVFAVCLAMAGCVRSTPITLVPIPDEQVSTPLDRLPERVAVHLDVDVASSAVLARAPNVRVSDAGDDVLATCTVAADASRCETSVPRRAAYTLVLEDATSTARTTTARFDAPRGLLSISIRSVHGPLLHAANVTPWWSRVEVVLDAGDSATEVELVPIGGTRLRVRNVSASTVLTSPSASFTHYRDGTCETYGTFCELGADLDRLVPLAPHETRETQAGPTRSNTRPEGGSRFRAEIEVIVVRAAGSVVPAAERESRVPEPSITERKLAVIGLDDHTGWIW